MRQARPMMQTYRAPFVWGCDDPRTIEAWGRHRCLDSMTMLDLPAELRRRVPLKHRLAFSYWGFPLLARMLMVHRIVREDGQLSIARSFRKPEWEDYLRQAGIAPEQVRIVRRFASRLCVERVR